MLTTQQLFQVTIAPTNVANRPVITANVILTHVTLDTTGLTSGTWVLNLDVLTFEFPSRTSRRNAHEGGDLGAIAHDLFAEMPLCANFRLLEFFDNLTYIAKIFYANSPAIQLCLRNTFSVYGAIRVVSLDMEFRRRSLIESCNPLRKLDYFHYEHRKQ